MFSFPDDPDLAVIDLTFQKWFLSFPNENNSKTDFKWLRNKENFSQNSY